MVGGRIKREEELRNGRKNFGILEPDKVLEVKHHNVMCL